MAGQFDAILTHSKTGVRLKVKAKAGARLSEPAKARIVQNASGKPALEIGVTARAQDGKANSAILVFLAAELGLRKSDLSISTGATVRLKLIEITGDSDPLYTNVSGWLRKKFDATF
jgi:uncharacterized protein YggU (UPF0235/DUF167 family)